MANYYTKFSFILDLATEVQRNAALELAQRAAHVRDREPPPADFPEALFAVLEDWTFATDVSGAAHELWLHSEDGGLDAVCAFVQHLLFTYQPDGVVTFEWSHDCSQPRVDGYGGGAAVVTAHESKTFSTASWLQEHTGVPA